jgi:uncharacterized protein (DUF1330 family)
LFDQPEVPANACAEVDPSEASLKQLAQQTDDGPFLMLNLLEFAPNGGRERFARYGEVAAKAIRDRGGDVLYVGEPLTGAGVPEAAREGWDRIVCVRYPSRASYLDMQQDPAYRAALPDRRNGLARRMLYVTQAGSRPGEDSDVHFPLERVESTDPNEIFVINMLRFRGPEGLADYARYSHVVGPEIQKRGGSTVLLLRGELPLVSDDFWHEFLLVRYPSLESVMSMMSTDKWQDAAKNRERALHGRGGFPTRPVS